EPPLVITTHAITSFRQDIPVPRESSLERKRASSPSYHARTTRANPACVSGPTPLIYQPTRLDQPATPKFAGCHSEGRNSACGQISELWASRGWAYSPVGGTSDRSRRSRIARQCVARVSRRGSRGPNRSIVVR